MNFEIIKGDMSIKIINDKGDYIDLDIPNKEGWIMLNKFLEESKK